jgi:hypothetical protein
MTTAIPAQPLTAVDLLFGADQDSGQALAQALDEQGVVSSLGARLQLLSQVGRQAASSQVASVAYGLLDLDLGDLVVAGWREQHELAAAAERTAANPGGAELVELATHRISSVHRPFVELLINDVRVATVNFELDIEFVVKALVVTVRSGHVVSLHSGMCEVRATLAVEGLQLASRRAHSELPLLIRWPVLLRLGGDSDPLPYGARPPSTSSASRPTRHHGEARRPWRNRHTPEL